MFPLQVRAITTSQYSINSTHQWYINDEEKHFFMHCWICLLGSYMYHKLCNMDFFIQYKFPHCILKYVAFLDILWISNMLLSSCMSLWEMGLWCCALKVYAVFYCRLCGRCPGTTKGSSSCAATRTAVWPPTTSSSRRNQSASWCHMVSAVGML